MKSLTSKNYHKNGKKEKKTRINKKEKKNISRKNLKNAMILQDVLDAIQETKNAKDIKKTKK